MEPNHDFRGIHFSWPRSDLSDFVELKGFPGSWEDVILRKNSHCIRISHESAPFLVTLNWIFSSFLFFRFRGHPPLSTFLFPPHHSTPAQFAHYEFVLFHHSWIQDFLCSGYLLVSDIIHFHNNLTMSIPRILAWLDNLFLIANTRQMALSCYFVQSYINFIHPNEDFCCCFECILSRLHQRSRSPLQGISFLPHLKLVDFSFALILLYYSIRCKKLIYLFY